MSSFDAIDDPLWAQYTSQGQTKIQPTPRQRFSAHDLDTQNYLMRQGVANNQENMARFGAPVKAQNKAAKNEFLVNQAFGGRESASQGLGPQTKMQAARDTNNIMDRRLNDMLFGNESPNKMYGPVAGTKMRGGALIKGIPAMGMMLGGAGAVSSAMGAADLHEDLRHSKDPVGAYAKWLGMETRQVPVQGSGEYD